MISEEDFAAAASDSDPNMAFLRLESRFRQVLKDNLDRSDNNYSYGIAIGEYINHTIAAAQYFNIDILDFFEVPIQTKALPRQTATVRHGTFSVTLSFILRPSVVRRPKN